MYGDDDDDDDGIILTPHHASVSVVNFIYCFGRQL